MPLLPKTVEKITHPKHDELCEEGALHRVKYGDETLWVKKWHNVSDKRVYNPDKKNRYCLLIGQKSSSYSNQLFMPYFLIIL